MTKYEIANYLVNLHTLLTAQDSAGGVLKSQTLATEYERQWGLLKEAITNEKESDDDQVRRGLRASGDAAVDPQSGGRSGSRDDVPIERRYGRAKGD